MTFIRFINKRCVHQTVPSAMIILVDLRRNTMTIASCELPISAAFVLIETNHSFMTRAHHYLLSSLITLRKCLFNFMLIKETHYTRWIYTTLPSLTKITSKKGLITIRLTVSWSLLTRYLVTCFQLLSSRIHP